MQKYNNFAVFMRLFHFDYLKNEVLCVIVYVLVLCRAVQMDLDIPQKGYSVVFFILQVYWISRIRFKIRWWAVALTAT